MDGERITLRLEPEDLELLDSFIEKRPEFASRSQLARMAIRAFIEGAQVSSVSEEMGNRVTVELPRAALFVVQAMVREGVYNSVGGAIEETVRKEFLKPEYLEEMKKRVLEARDAVKMLP
ncbi:MAG: ribbon-helix-helix domain-containing protein [Methanomassiliicoccales archaeon]|nr:ribbon-helix-helix domain-containing protein [Methanomassiliicoccales archaeon]